MYIPLNGPSVNSAISVGTTAVEVKVGPTVLEERVVVTIQPLDGVVYFGFTPSTTSTNGTKVFKGQYFSLEASDLETVYIVSETGTVDVRISERS